MTDRLFAVDGSTPAERATRRSAAEAAQGALFAVAPPTVAYCHACTGDHDVAACTLDAGSLF